MSTETKITANEASEMLTNGEIGLIEKHYGGGDFLAGKLTANSMTGGLIWAMERRKPVVKGQRRFDWPQVEAMTTKQMEEYFAPEPIEVDPEDPDSESGKDDSPDA